MSIGHSPFEASPFCRSASELDMHYAVVAIERSLVHPEIRPAARKALEQAIDIIRGEQLEIDRLPG